MPKHYAPCSSIDMVWIFRSSGVVLLHLLHDSLLPDCLTSFPEPSIVQNHALTHVAAVIWVNKSNLEHVSYPAPAAADVPVPACALISNSSSWVGPSTSSASDMGRVHNQPAHLAQQRCASRPEEASKAWPTTHWCSTTK